MSLLRNLRSPLQAETLTIQRFLDDTPFVTGVYSRLWLGLNNAYLKENNQQSTQHYGFKNTTTLLMKCEIASDAEGPIWGVTGSVRIVCDSGNIKWYDTSNTLQHTVAITEGTHILGFMSDGTNLKPYYEGTMVNVSLSTSANERDWYVGALSTDVRNGAVTGTYLTSSSQTYAIKVYEIIGNVALRTTQSFEAFMHLYAASQTLNASTGFMYETRAALGSSSYKLGPNVGTGGASGLGPHVTYGIQLHDLQEAFGTPYRQLLACICADGGVDRGGGAAEQYHAGWEDPVAVNEDKMINADRAMSFAADNHTFDSAIYLATSRLPSGYSSLVKPVDYYDLDDGQLIRGRQPKWSIWNDSINFGKYIKKVPVTVPSYDKLEYRFNIFRDVYGRDIFSLGQTDLLGVFDGYNTRSSAIHAPRIIIPETPTILKFNQDMLLDLSQTTRYPGYSFTCFPYTQETSGNITACVGNLPWWNLTKAEQDAFAQTGDNTLESPMVYGVVLQLQIWNPEAITHWTDIAKFVSLSDDYDTVSGQTVWRPLCSESSQAMKNKYRINGAETTLRYGGTGGYSDLARLADDEDFVTRVIMSLPTAHNEDISLMSCVDCSSVVPAKDISAQRWRYLRDVNLIGETNGKVYINEEGSDVEYDIYLLHDGAWVYSVFGVWRKSSESSTNVHYALGNRFALVKHSDSSVRQLFDTSTGKPIVIAYLECTRMASWASLLGANASNVVADQPRSDFPSTGNSSKYYVDIVTGDVYHWVNGAYVKEVDTQVTDYNSLPSTGASNTTYVTEDYKCYRWSDVTNAYFEIPRWYKKGVMYSHLNGFAMPFRYYDVPNSGFTDNAYEAPLRIEGWDGDLPIYSYMDDNITIPSSPSGSETNRSKYGLAVLYLGNIMQSFANGDNYPKGEVRFYGTDMPAPALTRFRLFDINNAPHSWGVYALGSTFSDHCESWLFSVGSGVNLHHYQVINSEHLLNKGTSTIIYAYLRLYDNSNIEKTGASNFVPFKVDLWKQSPCYPYKHNSNGYVKTQSDEYQFDETYGLTTLASDVVINTLNQDVAISGTHLYYHLYAQTALGQRYQYDGVSPSLQAADKSANYQPDCYILMIAYDNQYSSDVEDGCNYLFRIKSNS